MAKNWKDMERSIAKMLGEWWGWDFRRTPSSGAWNTQSRNMGHGSTDFHGDIVAPPEANFPFSVECKAYREVEIYKALYGKANVFDWWKQCREDSKAAGKFPMLIMKENRKQPLVVFSSSVFSKMLLAKPELFQEVPFLKLRRGKQTLAIMDLKSFVQHVPAKFVKRMFNVA